MKRGRSGSDEGPVTNAARAPDGPTEQVRDEDQEQQQGQKTSEAPPEQEDRAERANYAQGPNALPNQDQNDLEAGAIFMNAPDAGPGSSNVAAFNPAENPALMQGLVEFMNGAEDLTQEQRVLQQGALVASMRTAAGSPLAQGPDAESDSEEPALPLKHEVA